MSTARSVAPAPCAPDDAALPRGWRLELDRRTRVFDDGRSLLTMSGRLLRLGPGGPAAIEALRRGEGGPAARRLGRRLLGSGAAHPTPPPGPAGDTTVVIPVRDRTRELAGLLSRLAGDDVLVVDDGSVDGDAVEAVCREHGARYVRRDNGGPAAARNSALPLLHKDFVAFLDSDCTPPPGWLERLRGHLEDPLLGAVAPRVSGGMRSPLDRGARPALVSPGTPVSYVPTACLLVRRSAMTRFDEGLRYGEDVDLVWRIVDAGWQVRYDPSITVDHREPLALRDRVARRFRYGTSAAPLSQRHPDRLSHLALRGLPAAAVVLALARRPGLASLAAAVSVARVNRQVRNRRLSVVLVGRSLSGSARGVGEALALLGPLAWGLALRRRRFAVLLTAPYLAEWAQHRPPQDPVRYVRTALLDQAAYGAGVLAGCVSHRTWTPLRPRLR